MRLKPHLKLVLAVFLVCTASSALAQAAPSADETNTPFSVGLGFSGFTFPSFGTGHILGATLWAKYTPIRIPWILHGIGLEGEARDLNFGRSSNLLPVVRSDIAAIGPVYTWQHYRDVHPYARAQIGYGNADYPTTVHPRYHQSRTLTCAGAGVEYRVSRSVWVRADYEYQFWADFFKHPGTTIPPGQWHPQGFTVGAMYHIGSRHSH